MGFTVSSLTDYVNQSSTELLTVMQFAGETAGLATIQTGIKSSAALQILTNSPVPQDGASCGFNASGDTAFTQRTITTAAVKYQDSLCPRSLEAKWTQLLLKAGQHYTEADIPKLIIDDVAKQIIRRNETADWQGDTTSVSAYLKLYDGLAKIIKAASNEVIATASTYNATNCRTIIQDIISKIPAALQGDPEVTIFMGYPEYTIYLNKLATDNLYHKFGNEMKYGEVLAENSPYKIKAVHGLDNLSEIYALKPSNMFLGVDMENEHEDAKMWIDGSDNETVKYSFRFRRGWQVAHPQEIVRYANT